MVDEKKNLDKIAWTFPLNLYFDARSNKSVNISLKLISAWNSCWVFWANDRFSLGLGISFKVAARGGTEKYRCCKASLALILLALSYLTNCLNKSTASSGLKDYSTPDFLTRTIQPELFNPNDSIYFNQTNRILEWNGVEFLLKGWIIWF